MTTALAIEHDKRVSIRFPSVCESFRGQLQHVWIGVDGLCLMAVMMMRRVTTGMVVVMVVRRCLPNKVHKTVSK